jgi:hypothetical protein
MKFTYYDKTINISQSEKKCPYCTGILFVAPEVDPYCGDFYFCPACRRGMHILGEIGPVAEGEQYNEQRVLNAIRELVESNNSRPKLPM